MSFAQPFRDYEIQERIGAGAMGTVFKARHEKLNRLVALKVLRPSLARDARYVDRLRREARIVASLNHPNIVAGYDLGEEGGYHFFVMEYIEGKSLKALLSEWGMFPEQQVLDVAIQVASALDHAYQRGVIHRDVKPGNILIDGRGRVKLTDMGLAKGPTDLTLTRDGATVGTPQYISPEQARSPQDVDVRSDLYSLGATLYHMATGQPPFRGESMAEVITKVLSEPARPPQELNPDLSPGLALVIRKLLVKDLGLRYQTPRELLEDLQRVRQNEAPAVDAGRLLAAERGVARRPWLRAAAVAGLVLAVLAGIWALAARGGTPAPEPDVAGAFLVRLDADLAQHRTWGERWIRLQSAAVQAPAGAGPLLRERQARVLTGMQRALDDVVQAFAVERRAEVEGWLRDVPRWAQPSDFERELLAPALRTMLGVGLESLPDGIDRGGLRDLQDRVAGLARRRDEELLALLDRHIATEVVRAAAQAIRSGDFAGAEAAWDQGLVAFADGSLRPSLDRLSDTLRQEVRRRYTAARTAGEQELVQAETEAARALRDDAAAGLQALEQRLEAGTALATLEAGLHGLRGGLQRTHPDPARFRLGADPWPGVEQMFAAFDRRLDLLAREAEAGRIDWYLALAYRCLYSGGLAEAAELLREVRGERPETTAELQRHRAALVAAQEVEQALLAALQRSEEPLQGFPRSAPLQAVPLSVVRSGGRLVLRVEPPGAPAREAFLTEFLVRDLLVRAERADPLLFRSVAPEHRARGLLVLAMAGDEMAGLEARLREAGDEFLLEAVWPRLLRLRGEQGDAGAPDRRDAWTRVLRAWRGSQESRDTAPLESALLAFRGRFRETELEPAERRELQAVEAWLRAEKARQAAAARLLADAPQGARVTVRSDGTALEAQIDIGLAGLLAGAGEGWSVVEQPAAMLLAEAAGIDDLQRRRLEVSAGLPAGLSECSVAAVIWLPSSGGDRMWLFEFRGAAALLALAGDGSVGAALLEPGELQSRDGLQRAMRRSLVGFLGSAPRPHAVPGALHRLSLEVASAPGRGRARVRVLFEGNELAAEIRDLDQRAVPALRVLPFQAIGIQSVRLSGRGL